MMKKIIIIILHFGDSTETNNCLKSIFKNKITYDEILVVNNNSNFTLDFNKEKLKINIIKNKKNLGYAGGMNVGIKYGLAKKYYYFLLLNNDIILQNNFVADLTKFLDKNKKIGIASPVIKFQRNGQVVYDLGGMVNLHIGRTRHIESEKILSFNSKRVDYISGCCMLIRREVLKKVGLFDERFFLYYEDVDFCLRAKKMGYKLFVETKKSIYHKLSSSVGKNSSLAVYNQTLSAVLFGKKYSSSINKLLNIVFILMQSLLIFLKNPRIGRYAFSGVFYGIH